jgi:glucose-1-phosphate cytidylyltransferase
MPGRFGSLTLGKEQTHVDVFHEKPADAEAWINGGFFVVEPQALDYIAGDSTIWEREPLENLARDGRLAAYKHQGFWQPMDSLRDKNLLEDLWASGRRPGRSGNP